MSTLEAGGCSTAKRNPQPANSWMIHRFADREPTRCRISGVIGPMTTTIRAGEPRDLLSLIPFQLGFRPRDSAVLISLRGSRVGLVIRVDLPDLAHTGHGRRLARSLARHLVADGASGAIVVLYTDEDLQADPTTGRRALDHVAEATGAYFSAPECWVVGPRGYYALECDDHECCPPGGRPLRDLESTVVGAEMVLLGAGVADSREDLARMPQVDADARRSARRAAGRWQARGARAAGLDRSPQWRRESLDLWRALVRDESGTAPDFGRLQAALDDVLVRDAILVDLVPGFARVAEQVSAGWDGPEVGDAFGAIIDPDGAVPPPVAQVEAAANVLRLVAAHRPSRTAPAVTVLAMVAWWLGDGARAGVLIDRALAEDPDYRLAALLDHTLANGLPPGWLRPSSRSRHEGA